MITNEPARRLAAVIALGAFPNGGRGQGLGARGAAARMELDAGEVDRLDHAPKLGPRGRFASRRKHRNEHGHQFRNDTTRADPFKAPASQITELPLEFSYSPLAVL